jgi:predicted ATP-dependent endonuclease of OLD family
MAINKIRLKNFTVFDDVQLELAAGINVFIGENGVGKTHLLKVLYAFCESGTDMAFLNKLDNCMTSTKNGDSFVHLSPLGSSDKQIRYCIDAEEKQIDVKANSNNLLNDGKPFSSANDAIDYIDSNRVEKIVSAFIPAKEMLTHVGLEKDYKERVLPFDDTLIDILNKCGVSELRKLDDTEQSLIDNITEIIGGNVEYENNKYYIKHNDVRIGFATESEGYKKFATIYRLIETGNLRKGSVLFWDEPEANINPKNIPALVKILFALQRIGVQIFLATHNYFIAKYLNTLKTDKDNISFHALYKSSKAVKCESGSDFELLDNNLIIKQSISLYEEEVTKVLG